MAKIKLTKNELKKQKDELKMYQRYLPTLMLKKQQLQTEIRVTENRIRALRAEKERIDESFRSWIAVFGERGIFYPGLLRVTAIRTATGNIAGVEIPVFKGAEFMIDAYDLMATPMWIDSAAEKLKAVLLLDLESVTLEEQRRRLEKELRTTTQRVNLFEKVKIPESKSNIKKIRVYLGDQQTAAVVRGKIAKRGMERVAE
ncbi:MAG: V-type ATP synthase subunit D [Treponema sp. GWB1_62_6]|nr:MAG: V-type ATP synthase subunit D [Treponema sp. GWA1_62_8]OHE62596.1 MAG: V-type ATP synthase subunit D [Treponema sp. GWB1_62_6]OHE63771.1 MAG: V-type ATP synthase subunit D [Treponema sp. GWC1_61_84]OHE68700.1 MAG: V-type ATP synthase subunit D [Treponema sp. RIFOXYC1_FULL_61_9]HCM27987.1 V-type ATP synthase subunit D [Treponema sp.]